MFQKVVCAFFTVFSFDGLSLEAALQKLLTCAPSTWVQTFVQREGVEFIRIDGSTPQHDRSENVKRFQSRPEVTCCSVASFYMKSKLLAIDQ